MVKPHIIVAECFCVAIVFMIGKNIFEKKPTDIITIGIIKTTSHQALDQVERGFTEYLKSKLGNNIEFIMQNAQGSAPLACTIANGLHKNKRIKAICAIGTMAAQAVVKIEKTKPVFLAAVTEAESLAQTFQRTNLCGTSEYVDVQSLVKGLLFLVPNAKKVALLFTPSDPSSMAIVKRLEQELALHKLSWVYAGITEEREITYAVTTIAHNADAIIIPIGSMLACTMDVVGALAYKTKKPVIICDNLLVGTGILASAGGISYRALGKETAKIALDVLIHNQKPETIGLCSKNQKRMRVHRKTAQVLGIIIPQKFEYSIKWIDRKHGTNT